MSEGVHVPTPDIATPKKQPEGILPIIPTALGTTENKQPQVESKESGVKAETTPVVERLKEPSPEALKHFEDIIGKIPPEMTAEDVIKALAEKGEGVNEEIMHQVELALLARDTVKPQEQAQVEPGQKTDKPESATTEPQKKKEDEEKVSEPKPTPEMIEKMQELKREMEKQELLNKAQKEINDAWMGEDGAIKLVEKAFDDGKYKFFDDNREELAKDMGFDPRSGDPKISTEYEFRKKVNQAITNLRAILKGVRRQDGNYEVTINDKKTILRENDQVPAILEALNRMEGDRPKRILESLNKYKTEDEKGGGFYFKKEKIILDDKELMEKADKDVVEKGWVAVAQSLTDGMMNKLKEIKKTSFEEFIEAKRKEAIDAAIARKGSDLSDEEIKKLNGEYKSDGKGYGESAKQYFQDFTKEQIEEISKNPDFELSRLVSLLYIHERISQTPEQRLNTAASIYFELRAMKIRTGEKSSIYKAIGDIDVYDQGFENRLQKNLDGMRPFLNDNQIDPKLFNENPELFFQFFSLAALAENIPGGGFVLNQSSSHPDLNPVFKDKLSMLFKNKEMYAYGKSLFMTIINGNQGSEVMKETYGIESKKLESLNPQKLTNFAIEEMKKNNRKLISPEMANTAEQFLLANIEGCIPDEIKKRRGLLGPPLILALFSGLVQQELEGDVMKAFEQWTSQMDRAR